MDAFLLWWKRKFCDHIWKMEKSEKLEYQNVRTRFPLADYPGKKFVIRYDVVAEQQKCVVCGATRVIKVDYQISSKLEDA